MCAVAVLTATTAYGQGLASSPDSVAGQAGAR